jgi:hypothetical protein
MTRRARFEVTLAIAAAFLLAAGPAFSGFGKVGGGIEFTYDNPSAGSVHLAGNFNNWNMNADPMVMDESGIWRTVVDLGPGTYEYKFVVNGSEWIADPDNPVVVGAYGNSELVVDEDGEPVFAARAAPISNTPVSSRVKLEGWYRASYNGRSDVPSDPRWRLSRPEHEVYLSVRPTITSNVSGDVTLRMFTGEGEIKEVEAQIYSGHGTLTGGPFSVTAFYNEEILQWDDPLETVGHRDLVFAVPGSLRRSLPGRPTYLGMTRLAGTVGDDDLPFGRGAQGIILSADLPGELTLDATWSNVHDAHYLLDPEIYDDTDTDLLAARVKLPTAGPTTLGATYTAVMDAWWLNFNIEQNEFAAVSDTIGVSPELETYINGPDSESDWFELATSERVIGLDVAWPVMPGILDVRGEVAHYSYDSRWDVANKVRVEGQEDYSNGEINVPIGDMDGVFMKGILEGTPLGPLNLHFEATRFSTDGMDAVHDTSGVVAEAFISPDGRTRLAPPFLPAPYAGFVSESPIFAFVEAGFEGSPLVLFTFDPRPEYSTWQTEFDADLRFGIFDLGFELDADLFDGEFDPDLQPGKRLDFEGSEIRVAGRARADLRDERLWGELELESTAYDATFGNGLLVTFEAPDVLELTVRGEVGLAWEDWSVLGDLRMVSYSGATRGTAVAVEDTVTGEISIETEYEYRNRSESYFTPYLALVYRPRPTIELRASLGISPTDYVDAPFEGRAIGRDRWRADYLWDHADHDLLDAEEALADAWRTIGVMGVLKF